MDSGFGYHAETIQRHIEIVPGYEPLRASLLPDIDVGPSTLQQVLEAAADFAERVLVPINRSGDRQGCRLEGGRVLTPPGYREAWSQLVEAGWNSVDQPSEFGGQGLPSFVNAACRELF